EKILPSHQAIEYILQIAGAAQHAHSNKIIHRDLRPSNIILSEQGVLKVTDFGTSAWLNSNPYASTRIGSPPYMAPEQFLGKASYQSDIYSIGCIFYEMILGRPPIFDPDPFKILEKAKDGKITPPRIKNNNISKEIDGIIMKCLAADLNHRYQKAADIVSDLTKSKGKKADKSEIEDIMARIKAREKKISASCWNCHKPLPYKAKHCHFCGEAN
ncbi:MAG: serine/threonine-protein kinase, partial [Candidatus Aminicenantaceae bacterium]